MATKTQNIEPKTTISFTDVNGAAINVPCDQAPIYTAIKSEQVAALNDLLADHIGGSKIELSEIATSTLAGLAKELAHINNHMVAGLMEKQFLNGESK